MSSVKEALKNELRVEQDVEEHLKGIEGVLKSRKTTASKLDYIRGVLGNLAEQVVEAKVDAMFEQRTKLLSAAAADEFLSREFEEYNRSGRVFTVLLMDLDGLKKINDELGHVVGTEVIVRVAESIKKSIRKVDMASRYGGDEFLVILRGSKKETVERVLERMLKKITEIKIKGLKRVGISVGYVSVDEKDFTKAEAVLKLADKRLYADKARLK